MKAHELGPLMADLAELMANASAELQGSLRASRVAFQHNLTKGEATEAALRQFMRRHYPQSVGVGHGQVMDSKGAVSTQLDVVLYDSIRTPLLFQDAEEGLGLFPAEGVIGVIECKTKLQCSDLSTLAQRAQRLKTLDRSALYTETSPLIKRQVSMYGRDWGEGAAPPLYCVFALEGPKLDNVATTLEDVSGPQDCHEQIDLVCILDQGVVVNRVGDGTGMLDAVPSPGSVHISARTAHSLLLFHVLLSRYVLQMRSGSIAIQKYLPTSFVF